MKQKKSRLSLRLGKVWLYAMFLFVFSLMSEIANAQRCDLVVNGSFAQQLGCPQATFTSDYQCRAAAPVGGAGYAIVTNAAQWNGPWYGLDQFPGSNFLIVDGGNGTGGGTRIWIQTVRVVAGRTYTFNVSAKNIVNPGSGAGQDAVNPTISLRANGTTVVTSVPLVQTPSASTWTAVSGTYVATTTGNISIDVTQNLTGGYNDLGIDNISFEYDMPTPTVNAVTLCEGNTAVFTATGATNGEVYEWYTSSTRQDLVFTGNPFVTPALTGNMVYWVAIKADGTCSLNRVPAIATVTSVSTPGSLIDQTICSGSAAMLTGNGAAAGEVYEWYTSAVGGSPLYSNTIPVGTSILNTSVTYWLGIRNAAGCRSSRVPLNITVNPTPAAPVVVDQLTICAGSRATITASGASNGSVYVWYTSPNGTTPVFTGNPFVTPVINSNISYYVSIRNAQACVSTRKKVTIQVNPVPTAPVVNNVTICGPASTSITAPGIGTTQWYTSATSAVPFFTGATLNTPVLATTTSYWVSKTNASSCESPRAEVVVTVNPRPNAPVTANATRCDCGSVLLTASGSTGTYAWYTTAVGGTSVFQGANFNTPNLCNTTNYWVSAISNGCESPRVQATAIINVIDLVINGNFAQPGGCPQPTFGSDYQCVANPGLGNVNLAVTNNPAPWNRNLWWAVDRTGNTNFLISDGTNVGNNRLWFQQVNVTQGQQYVYTVWTRNIVNPNTVSNGIGSGITLNINGTQVAASGQLPTTAAPNVWTRVSAVYTATTSGFVSIDVRHVLNGFSDIAIDDISFARVTPTPTVVNQVICSGARATLFASGGDAADAYDWYTSATGGTPVFVGNPYVTPVLTATTDYWVVIRIPNGCTSARVQVKVTVNPVPATPTVTDLTLCGPASATLTATGGPILNWYSSAVGGVPLFTGATYVTPILNANTSYWVSATNAQGCASPRVQANVIINLRPDAPVTTSANRCGCGTLVLTASGSSGIYNWYATPNGGAVLATGASFTTPNICSTTNYYATAVSAAGCESSRVIATATVAFPVNALNLVTNGNFALPHACPQTGFTYDYQCDAAPGINGAGWLAVTSNAVLWNGPWWGTNRSGDGTNFLIADGSNNINRRIWIQTVNVVAGQQYRFTIWARNIVNPGSGAGNDRGPGTVSLRVNNTVLVTSPALVQTAPTAWTQVVGIYTATATGPVNLDVFQNVTNNGYNDVAIDDIIFAGIAPTPTVNSVISCANLSATLTASGAPAGSTYAWYDVAVNGTAVFIGNPFVTPVLTTTTSYWVAIRDANGCETDRVRATVTINGDPVVVSTTNANRCDCGTLTLTATGDAGTYNWYDAATGGNLVGTGTSFTTPSICNTTTYYVSVTNANGCVSLRRPATASITGAAVTLTGSTQVYANAIIQYTLTIANNSGVDMNGIVINPSLAGFVLDPTLSPNPLPAGPYNILAGGAPITVTYQGYFPTAGVPQTICFNVLVNGCTTQVCKTITNVYAGCPFSYSAVTSDCDTEEYGPNGVVKTISLSGHNNFFDVTSIDFNMTYDPAYLALVNTQVVGGSPAGTTVTTTSTTNPNGTITLNGTITYGSKVDILNSNGDGDIVVSRLVDANFRILARPLNTCDLQLPTTGTTFYTATTTLLRPTDLARFVFLCAPCPAISAYFTASQNPILQGSTITFAANPTGGAHTWYSGENNDRQLGSTSPTATYVYRTPGTYTVTHYRTENGLTGIYTEDITVCGITTTALVSTSICSGNTIAVPFTASACAAFQAGNQFTAQLSNASGSFANPVNIGTLVSTTSGQINATLPNGTAFGTGYRIRIVSTSPALVGTDNGANLTVNSCNSSVVFDGVNDIVTIPHNAAYNVGSGNFTLEALIQVPAGTTGEMPIFSKRTSGSNGFLLYLYGTSMLLQMNGVPNYQTGTFTNVYNGACHHIAITRVGSTVTFYVDGNAVSAVSSTRGLNSPGPLYIGHDSQDGSYFTGAINEVRFWNIGRTAADIAANANTSLNAASTGLIGLWRFNETGQTVLDASSIANNGFLGTNVNVESSDPTRGAVKCNTSDRHDVVSVDAVYSGSSSLNVTASPNPFTAQTIVSVNGLSSNESTYHVEVYSMHGLLMLSKDVNGSEEIVLGNELTAGMYLVKVTENGTSHTVKIIKE